MNQVAEGESKCGRETVDFGLAAATDAPEAKVIEQGALVPVDHGALGVLCFGEKDKQEARGTECEESHDPLCPPPAEVSVSTRTKGVSRL